MTEEIKISFCDFTENSTVQSFRQKFTEEEDYRNHLINDCRPNNTRTGKVSDFDATLAVLLGCEIIDDKAWNLPVGLKNNASNRLCKNYGDSIRDKVNEIEQKILNATFKDVYFTLKNMQWEVDRDTIDNWLTYFANFDENVKSVVFCGKMADEPVASLLESFPNVFKKYRDKLDSDAKKLDICVWLLISAMVEFNILSSDEGSDKLEQYIQEFNISDAAHDQWLVDFIKQKNNLRDQKPGIFRYIETTNQDQDHLTFQVVYDAFHKWAITNPSNPKKALVEFFYNGTYINDDVEVAHFVNIPSVIAEPLQQYKLVVFIGPPGTSKTYSVKETVERLIAMQCEGHKDAQVQPEKFREFIHFHPSYDYSDFVEGLRPVKGIDNQISFVRMDGIFKSFCRKIVERNKTLSEHYQYYFIIDEINRADISKVFGELMFGMEESYRGPKNRIATPYHNIPCYGTDGQIITNDVFKEGFYVPENLSIIGTMNDIDRSVESFDFAFRRRFHWITINANEVMEEVLVSMLLSEKPEIVKELADKVKTMNDVITGAKYATLGLTKAYHIGPAYFAKYQSKKNNLKSIYKDQIEPLLREYTRGRDEKLVNELLEDCKKALGLY